MPLTAGVIAALFTAWGLEAPVCEFRFDAGRRWRFDCAWPDQRVALEIEGGVWTGGRHTRGAGFLADMEKYNAAVLQGWALVRTTPALIGTEATMRVMRELLTSRPRVCPDALMVDCEPRAIGRGFSRAKNNDEIL